MIREKRHKKLFENSTTGYGIIEIIIASFIILVGIGGAFGLIQNNISVVSAVEHRLLAIELAQEGAEAVHAIQKSNFIAIQYGQEDSPGIPVAFGSNGLSAASCSGGCEIRCKGGGNFPLCSPLSSGQVEVELIAADTFLNYDSVTAIYSQEGSGAVSIFKRKIAITEPSTPECPAGDCVAANVEVTWSEKGKPQSVQIETRLYDWLGLP